jgi:hypothetical protein
VQELVFSGTISGKNTIILRKYSFSKIFNITKINVVKGLHKRLMITGIKIGNKEELNMPVSMLLLPILSVGIVLPPVPPITEIVVSLENGHSVPLEFDVRIIGELEETTTQDIDRNLLSIDSCNCSDCVNGFEE